MSKLKADRLFRMIRAPSSGWLSHQFGIDPISHYSQWIPQRNSECLIYWIMGIIKSWHQLTPADTSWHVPLPVTSAVMISCRRSNIWRSNSFCSSVLLNSPLPFFNPLFDLLLQNLPIYLSDALSTPTNTHIQSVFLLQSFVSSSSSFVALMQSENISPLSVRHTVFSIHYIKGRKCLCVCQFFSKWGFCGTHTHKIFILLSASMDPSITL